jgi:DNA replication initiation complex subunit (GINS family)
VKTGNGTDREQQTRREEGDAALKELRKLLEKRGERIVDKILYDAQGNPVL